jgi:hypothetical protein
MTSRAISPGLHPGERRVDLFERDAGRDHVVEVELALEVHVDVAGHVDAEPVRSHVGALDLLLGQEREARQLDAVADRDHADDGGAASRLQHAEGLLGGDLEADRLEAWSTPPLVISITVPTASTSLALTASVARTSGRDRASCRPCRRR